MSTPARHLVILGAGTAGTIMANRLARRLPSDWTMTVVERSATHQYQPGFLFLPFQMNPESAIVRPTASLLPRRARLVQAEIDRIVPGEDKVMLAGGAELPYTLLIVATGSRIAPEDTAGMQDEGWGRDIFDFYTLDGARALTTALRDFRGGRLVVHINEMPIKCPIAPLEFAFLADWWLARTGRRERTELTFVTPLSGAFTKPRASAVLDRLLGEKNIEVVPEFATERIDPAARQLIGYDGQRVDYDLLVTIPTNMGDPAMGRSGLGDDLLYVATDMHTLQSRVRENIFVLGDATDLPTSKAGSVAHFEAEILTDNLLRHIRGEALLPAFDGHANCFIESGYGKAILLDFNYDVEPVEGAFPLPWIGPMSLLRESRLNHLGKLAFLWMYWNVLLPGRPVPFVGTTMSTAGKKLPPPLSTVNQTKELQPWRRGPSPALPSR